jgi:hypothetical protein
MRQFRKGKRLVALCEQKIQGVQRVLARLNSERKNLIEQIAQCESEIRSLEQMLIKLQFNEISVTKAEIYGQLKQKAFFLHQRQNAHLERTLHIENLTEIDDEIARHQKQLAEIKRKEMKFTRWMQQGKQQWMMQQESVSEDDKQDIFPWVM